jgi:TonB family protein
MTFLVDFGIKSGAVLSVAFLLTFAFRRGSASLRYAVWTCALAAVLVLPLASWVVPKWNIDRSAWRRATGTQRVQAQPSISVVVHAPRPAPAWPRELPMMLWIGGALAMIVRVVAGHWRVRMLFGRAPEIRDPLVDRTAASIGLGRAVVLKRSMATDVPLSYGLFRATVLLPSESAQWTEERRRIVLSHEMIHARRLDSLWGLLAQLALAWNWFNPLAWLAVRQFRKEQERSCDDAVVTAGTASTVYAAHLVDLARAIAIPEPALGMAERFDLEGRVHALLDSGRERKAASRTLCAAMLVVALALLVPLAAVHAQAARASIAGAVYDPSGAIVPGAAVSLKNTSAPNEELARSDSSGLYKLTAVPAGEYVVKVTAPGFAPYQKTLSLKAGTPAAMDVFLAIGEVKEAEEVVGRRSQSAPAAAPTRPRIRVGGMVQPIKLISKVSPDYPADAQAEGVEGTVLLRAIVSKNGTLLHVTSVSNSVDPRLIRAAMAAVPLWQYQPTLLNGEPVEVITTITVSFLLN